MVELEADVANSNFALALEITDFCRAIVAFHALRTWRSIWTPTVVAAYVKVLLVETHRRDDFILFYFVFFGSGRDGHYMYSFQYLVNLGSKGVFGRSRVRMLN